MKCLLVSLLAGAVLAAAPVKPVKEAKQTFTGVITDSMCGLTGHAAMRMGPTDAECTDACVITHGAWYALASGKNVYTLSNQQTPQQFSGKKVRVVGTLDAKTMTIAVDSIVLAPSSK